MTRVAKARQLMFRAIDRADAANAKLVAARQHYTPAYLLDLLHRAYIRECECVDRLWEEYIQEMECESRG